MSAADDILTRYQHVLSELRLICGSQGVFDVAVDGTVIFSKKAVGRHAEPGEVLARFRAHVGPEVEEYER